MNIKTIALAVAACGILSADLHAQPVAGSTEPTLTMPGSPLGIAWGFLYGYMGTPAESFLPQVRDLGGGFSKVYLFWNQLEPEKGKFDWTAVDAYVTQLHSRDEGLVALFSSSQWAVKRPSAMLPPSPASNPDDYYRFVNALVKHCKGRVRFWQNDCEPNDPIYWSGTKEEFVAQLKVFYKAVKDADPSATVVVGGYDGLFGPPGSHPFPNQQVGLAFFDYVLSEGKDAFDVFDLRLYGDPYTIVARVDIMRQKMQALGYVKPVICTEYGGPAFFQFPENRKYFSLLTSWMASLAHTGANGLPGDNVSGENQLEQLYQHINTLAPETQMFMLDCAPDLEARYERIQERGLVQRNLFAFAAGVQKTLYWQLNDLRVNRDNIMTLMYGKIGLVKYENGSVQKRYPSAAAFQRMAAAFSGIRAVKQIELPAQPSVFLFQVDRGARGPLFVVWERRDELKGEDAPDLPFACAWTSPHASATDILGHTIPTQVQSGQLHLPISLNPIFLEPKN